MRRYLLGGFIAVVCIVAGVATYRLSVDALALVIGVGLGFVLMMPVVGVLWWAARNSTRVLTEQTRHSVASSPPVIVVQPASHSALPMNVAPNQTQSPTILPPPGYPVDLPTTATPSRSWDLRVFGEEHMAERQEVKPEYPQW